MQYSSDYFSCFEPDPIDSDSDVDIDAEIAEIISMQRQQRVPTISERGRGRGRARGRGRGGASNPANGRRNPGGRPAAIPLQDPMSAEDEQMIATILSRYPGD